MLFNLIDINQSVGFFLFIFRNNNNCYIFYIIPIRIACNGLMDSFCLRCSLVFISRVLTSFRKGCLFNFFIIISPLRPSPAGVWNIPINTS